MLDRRTLLASLAALPFLAHGAARSATAPLSISRAGLIFLTVEVNGRSAKALVDTGSVRGIQLAPALAGQLGLSTSQTGRTTQRYDGAHPILSTRLATFAYADTRAANVEAFVSPGDIENISRQIGESFDAILGWPLLGARPFVIDYAARSFVNDGPLPRGGLVLPLEPNRPLPVTAGSLSGQPITFMVDTGAPHSNVDASLAGGAAIGSRVELPFEIGGRAFTTSFRVRDLTPMTRGVGARAVIGHRFLQAYSFAWDPAAREIRLVQAAQPTA